MNAIKKHQLAIVQSLPTDYQKTVMLLQPTIEDEQLAKILGSTNYFVANEAIVNCLIEGIKSKEDVLNFCDSLQTISLLLPDQSRLIKIGEQIKSGKYWSNCAYL